MPELPEVETVVRQLGPRVRGRLIAAVTVHDRRWCEPEPPARFAGRLRGRRIHALSRRGKYLVWALEGDLFLLQHLRMSGVLLWDPPTALPYLRAELLLKGEGEGPVRVAVCDLRRFGRAALFCAAALRAYLDSRLGPEPFSERFNATYLYHALRRRKGPIKGALLDQRLVAGVGNIYADEALFRAALDPRLPANRVGRQRAAQLVAGLREALAAGIEARGASIDSFRTVDGVRGAFQERFLVHRRGGLPCPACGRPILKTAVSGRGTYLCPRCQRRR